MATHGLLRAIEVAGGEDAFLGALAISRRSLFAWKASGVPPGRVWEVSRLTRVAPHDLRPDLYDHPSAYAPRAGSASPVGDAA